MTLADFAIGPDNHLIIESNNMEMCIKKDKVK